jgi:hypothetical protein
MAEIGYTTNHDRCTQVGRINRIHTNFSGNRGNFLGTHNRQLP